MLPTAGCDVDSDVSQSRGLNAKVKQNYLGEGGGVSPVTLCSRTRYSAGELHLHKFPDGLMTAQFVLKSSKTDISALLLCLSHEVPQFSCSLPVNCAKGKKYPFPPTFNHPSQKLLSHNSEAANWPPGEETCPLLLLFEVLTINKHVVFFFPSPSTVALFRSQE